MVRIALIGAGYIGTAHAKAILQIPGAKLTAVVDQDERAGKDIAAKFGCSYYSDAEPLLNDRQIDMIDICLPTFLHERYVFRAAACGKHVLCEKPFALSRQACMRMACACRRAGVKLMVAQVARWFPEYIEIKRMIDRGMLGTIHMVYANRLAQHPDWTSWHRDPVKSGGGLFDLHIHDIDYLYSLFGRIHSVYAAGWKSGTGCWNHVITTVRFRSGVNAVVEGSMEMTGDYPFSTALRATGDLGTVEYRCTAGSGLVYEEQEKNFIFYGPNSAPMTIRTESGDPFEAEMTAFIESIAKDTQPPIAPIDSIEVIGVMEAIQKSLETGHCVLIS